MNKVTEIFGLKPDEEITHGEATLSCIEKTEMHVRDFREPRRFRVPVGIYHRLLVNGELMMSDTPMELYSNANMVYHATGDVLIGGLGIGLLLHNLMDKLEKGKVTSVTVLEKSPDVIALISPFFQHPAIHIIHADVFDYKPTQKYQTIYMDIWPDIMTDNLKDIRRLHNKYKFYVDRTQGYWFMNSWMKEHLQSLNRNPAYY